MFEKEISEQIKKLYQELRSYDEVSARTKISKSVLTRIASGERPPKNPTIDFLLKLFPDARIELHASGNITNMGGDNSIVGNNFFPEKTAAIERIKDAIMASDLPAESKVIAYGIVTKEGK